MGRSLDELDSQTRPLAEALISKAYSSGMHVTLIDTGRTEPEQQVKLAQGVSWTQNSLHLPQPPEMKARAFDLAPTSLIVTKGWSPDSPLWLQLGEWGEAVGLEWGGRWQHHPDPSHFQLRPAEPVVRT